MKPARHVFTRRRVLARRHRRTCLSAIAFWLRSNIDG